MDRLTGLPVRPDWRSLVIGQGLGYVDTTTPDGQVVSYWREGMCYQLWRGEIDIIEAAARRLFEMFVEAGDHIIEHDLFARMGIPAWAVPAIIELWKDLPEARKGWYTPMLQGRFDLCPVTDEDDNLVGVRLFEYNADTPTGYPEASVIQWNWAIDLGYIGEGKSTGQWNSVWGGLRDGWMHEVRRIRRETGRKVDVIHFAYSCAEKTGEDELNLKFIAEAAHAASAKLIAEGEPGFEVVVLFMDEIVMTGSVEDDDDTVPVGIQYFSDPNGRHIEVIFKLFPFEWLLQQEFGHPAVENMLELDGTMWLEPIWKLMWSNKAILPILWKLFGDTDDAQYLVEAYFEDEAPPGFADNCVRKPIFGREGGRVQLIVNGEVVEHGPTDTYDGDTGADGPYVLQALQPLPDFSDNESGMTWHPIFGVYTVQDDPVGLIIRESAGLITNNLSFCAPHIVAGLLDEDKEGE